LDLEDCDGKLTGIENECSGCPSKILCQLCSQSAIVGVSSKTNNGINDDICSIGAGWIGAAIARELACYSLHIIWLEATNNVSQGATKGNSGIVHAGYDNKPDTNHAKYCWPGNQMFPRN
jgi:hypothetical protein